LEVVIAGDDYAGFAGEAGAEMGWGVGAEVVEVDGGVAYGEDGVEGTKGLADNEADAGMGGRCC